jgi:hypothetical protein
MATTPDDRKKLNEAVPSAESVEVSNSIVAIVTLFVIAGLLYVAYRFLSF